MPGFTHVTTRRTWAEAQRLGSYRAESSNSKGFIHFATFATPAQVADVADYTHRRTADLISLHVLPEKLEADLNEALGTSELYPPLYGPLSSNSGGLHFTPGRRCLSASD